MRNISHYFVLFISSLITIVCDEQSDKNYHPAMSDDYLSIFRNMPLLYEYIIDTLTKKPEVLEFSQSYYTDANIYDYYKRNNDAELNNDPEINESQRNERSDIQDDIDNKLKIYVNDVLAYRNQNPESNNRYLEQEYRNTVSKRENNINNEQESTIDPDEIVKKAMWVEDQLEKYNDSR
nr:uncharacterized protein LOC128679283 [Plodia interpunctella]